MVDLCGSAYYRSGDCRSCGHSLLLAPCLHDWTVCMFLDAFLGNSVVTSTRVIVLSPYATPACASSSPAPSGL